MSCEVQLQENSMEAQLFTVILKEPYFIFFQKTKIYKDLTAEDVKNLQIPFVKRIYRMDVPNEVYPKYILF